MIFSQPHSDRPQPPRLLEGLMSLPAFLRPDPSTARLRELARAAAILLEGLEPEAALQQTAELLSQSFEGTCLIHVKDESAGLRLVASASTTGPLKEDGSQLTPLLEAAQSGTAIGPKLPESLHAHLPQLQKTSCLCRPLLSGDQVLGTLTLLSARRTFTSGDVLHCAEITRLCTLALDNARRFRQAERINRIKDEFLATLSHELRTPSSIILGWLDLIESDGNDPALLSQGLEAIARNARLQAGLINDLLDLSRIITGKIHLEMGPVDLGQVVESAVLSLKPTASGKRLRVEFPREAQDNPLVFGDANRLQQVVWNLLSNAIKFTSEGQLIRISLKPTDQFLQLEIQDNGSGIDPAFLPFVFDRFRQGGTSQTRNLGGLGLGLTIVRHLVEVHGGTVSAASPGLNQGATFTVKLPLLKRGTLGE